MKKLLALVLVAVMAFSCLVLASCGDKKEETSTASENSTAASADESKAEESATSTEESAASADESAVSEEATSEEATSEDVTSEDATSEDAPVEIPEDVKATASYKYFSSVDLTKGFTFKTDLMGAKVSMSVLGENVYMETSIEMEGFSQSAKVIVKDGKAYMLDDAKKTYTVSEATGDELLIPVDEFSVEAIFGDLTFVSTTTEELEGVTFTVDTFKASEGTDAKIYMDAEGKVVMMGDAEMMVPFELTNTIPEGCFDIPADYKEAAIELPDVDFEVNEDEAA
jgi:hypothetical protein